jgi:hypothetical protein
MKVNHPEFGVLDYEQFCFHVGATALALTATARRAGHSSVKGIFCYIHPDETKKNETASFHFLADLLSNKKTEELTKRWTRFFLSERPKTPPGVGV